MSMDYAEEKVAKRVALLDLLSDEEWHTAMELREVGGTRYSARILELRRSGWLIESVPSSVSSGNRYRLLGLCEPQGKKVRAYLEPSDVEKLLAGNVTDAARTALADALDSFERNKDKL